MPAHLKISFGAFTVDGETRQLLRGPGLQPVRITPKAFDLLRILLERRPGVVGKDELHARLWPSSFVSEATLASLVGDVRAALSDDGRQPHYIRTVHGFGYAFCGTAAEISKVAPVQAETSVIHAVICNGREKVISDGEHLLGRDPDAAIVVPHRSVSRRHAVIVVAGDVAILRDLQSKNGTYVGNRRVTDPVQLADRDHIRMGAVDLVYQHISGGASTQTIG